MLGTDRGNQALATRPAPHAARSAAVDHEASLAALPGVGWREAIEATVAGLNFDLVEIERAPRGLLRITIDRRPGQGYPSGESEFIQVADCEQVTRQLQYVLEVEGLDYARLEVSSPGLDRLLRVEGDFLRFVGHEVNLTLKLPFQGRKHFRGLLQGDAGSWSLHLRADKPQGKGKVPAKVRTPTKPGVHVDAQVDSQADQQLRFELGELKEARLVPVVDFKGRRDPVTGTDQPAAHGGQVR